jgi:hypothetical protein
VTNDNVDTVTPMEGGGLEVTGSESVDLTTRNLPVEDYETSGKTRVRTRRGYAFASADENLPVVTTDGYLTDRTTADSLVEESSGLVYIDNEED